ncbi:hypothetical protein TELCIR_04446 [Teladorsagia circumcincta]|uniref:Rap-GAP domain-containing protein n=1 Tax=Teladorsagia circumcincta TaxID=45464 RepID=A0A2G9UTL9_TELCI|nr:hypothetical protein TELCIR_04446 [Teladorsagia circumcincta]
MEGQFPLPGFNVSKWNSVESTATKPNETQVFVQKDSAIIGVNKDQQLEVTSRTVVGRHCWVLEPHKAERKEWRNVNAWLQKEAQRGRRAGRESVGILGAMDDPFDALPRQSNVVPSKAPPEWMAILEDSRRQPQPLKPLPPFAAKAAPSRLHEWRSFSASLGFVPNVSEVPLNFSRDLKHLDQTCAREVHKVAVIYVADGQEDKQSILSNTTASPCFERFVSELGWQINASRAYRLAHKNHVRPLRHREHVFAHDTMRHMKKVRLSDAINALYIPTMTA